MSAYSLKNIMLRVTARSAAALCAVALLFSAAAAVETNVPLDLQAKLFLTALTFDKNLDRKGSDKLRMGILYFPGVPLSEREAVNFQRALREFEGRRVSGHPLESELLRYSSIDELRADIASRQINVLYIAAGTVEAVRKVTSITQEEKVLSLAGMPDYVVSCGVSMVVGYKLNRPKIYLNHTSTKAEGAEFTAKFLRIAEVLVD